MRGVRQGVHIHRPTAEVVVRSLEDSDSCHCQSLRAVPQAAARQNRSAEATHGRDGETPSSSQPSVLSEETAMIAFRKHSRRRATGFRKTLPHPGPLPLGEGDSATAVGAFLDRRLLRDVRTPVARPCCFPLPAGEGSRVRESRTMFQARSIRPSRA